MVSLTTTAETSASSPTDLSLPEHPWHAPADAVCDALAVDANGLATSNVEARRSRFGANILREVETRSIAAILLDQVKSLVVALLFAAALVSLFFGDIPETIAIVVVLVLNSAIGFFMEWRAVRSMEALHELADVPAVVRRNGTVHRISAEELVPGDIVLLEEGDVVTADVRLITTSKLQADESALTGESVPVDKSTDPVPSEAPLAERSSMVFKGTSITRGSGEGVVVHTGMDTELGDISSLVEEAESEATPLEERLDALARSLVGVVLVLGVLVAGAGILSGRELQLMIETGIALAVAAIPEGLPIVATIALARGLRRMAKRNALVRRLSSVETLGSTGIICTDKTGTLTENRMTVQQLNLPTGSVAVTTDGDAAPFQRNGEPVAPADDAVFDTALRVAVLCNTASLSTAARTNGAEADAVGDPMETALLRIGRLAELDRSALLEEWPEVGRDAFDRETKKMATCHKRPAGDYFVAVKGAPEAVLDTCSHVAQDGEPLPLDADRRAHWLDENQAMAEDGLRVIALASKTTDNADAPFYDGLQLLGLVGLLDPPRADVRASVGRCKHAGIDVVMVTGDQPATARHVARAVGLASEDAPVINGPDFVDPATASLEEREQILKTTIFSRATPRQKLDLIDLHQSNGRIVAMTGDGVNDAPALKSADIGIAMGQRGTQVAQEAADMVLQDDAFSTIVAAVEEGRTIYNNIQNFVYYLMSCNVGEVLVVGLASLAGIMLPLLPLQILFLNLVTDVFPALALGVGESETNVMDKPPRDPTTAIIGRRQWIQITLYGTAFTVAVLGALYVARMQWNLPADQAVTISFLTLALAQLWHVFNMRAPGSSIVRNAITRNRYVWGALVLCVALLLVAVYVPVLAEPLSVVPPAPSHWLLILGASFVPLLIGQVSLLFLPGPAPQNTKQATA
jgi:Ca2+-transporting ATPase